MHQNVTGNTITFGWVCFSLENRHVCGENIDCSNFYAMIFVIRNQFQVIRQHTNWKHAVMGRV